MSRKLIVLCPCGHFESIHENWRGRLGQTATFHCDHCGMRTDSTIEEAEVVPRPEPAPLTDVLMAALEAAARELAAHDAITKVLREEKGLPHIPCPVLAQVSEAVQQTATSRRGQPTSVPNLTNKQR